MIRVTLAFIALSAAACIYNAANRASIDTALQLAAMLAVGVTAGMLYEINRTRGGR